jgi:MFS family permease
VFVTMATVLVLCASYGLLLFAPTPLLALAALVPAGLGIALPPLVATSAALEQIPRVMRSSLLGVWMMAVSLIGMSSGPPLIGFLIDHAVDGPENVRWAFAASGAGGVLLVVPMLLLVRKPYLETQAAAAAADHLIETEPK